MNMDGVNDYWIEFMPVVKSMSTGTQLSEFLISF